MILENDIYNKKLYIIPKLNEKYLKKINKLIKINCVNNVVLSKNLIENNSLRRILKENNINIIDGKWLCKYMREKVINYIVNNKEENIYNQELSILVNDINESVIYNIKNLAKKVKILNIITKNEGYFKKIEKKIYEEDGIILNITNNYKKSLIKSDIILNIDFSNEEFSNYALPKKACIINIEKNMKIYSKTFDGINIVSFDISLPKRFIKQINKLKEFSPLAIYESFIYKRTSIKNIEKEINEDKIKILNVYGQNGIIRKSEFKGLRKTKI